MVHINIVVPKSRRIILKMFYSSLLFADFDMRVNDNKTTAEEALKRIPEIEATINAANEKTRQAETALGNAAADAKQAKSKAEEAEKIAANVQKVSTTGRTRAVWAC